MTPIAIVPATTAHFQRYHGHPPIRSTRAIAAVRGDEVLGIAGTYPHGAYLGVYFDRKDELAKQHPRVIVRGIRMLMKMDRPAGAPLLARADPNIDGSDRMLEHMGFQPIGGGFYVWK